VERHDTPFNFKSSKHLPLLSSFPSPIVFEFYLLYDDHHFQSHASFFLVQVRI
jgi:hypothetical protein